MDEVQFMLYHAILRKSNTTLSEAAKEAVPNLDDKMRSANNAEIKQIL